MVAVTLIFFLVAHMILVVAILCGLVGWCGPTWSQRLGNAVVVLSLVALLIKISSQEMHLPFSDIVDFDVWSCLLAIIGAFWALIGDVACRAVHSPEGWNGELRKAIRQ